MKRRDLISLIEKRKSFLCVGLDPDPAKIPAHLLGEEDPIFAFNKEIIDATRDLCVAYKPNTAFYECRGVEGWQALEKTIRYIGKEHFTIADAKRGDIGNTSRMYAEAFFKTLGFDSVTVAPYMGHDSVKPFLGFPDKWAIMLALTSNAGAVDFQFSQVAENEMLFEKVISTALEWGSPGNLMFVVGATRPEFLSRIRALAPDYFLLVPGVGAQGGSLAEVAEHGMNAEVGLLVNSSRGIIHASSNTDFAEAAREAAHTLSKEMALILREKAVF